MCLFQNMRLNPKNLRLWYSLLDQPWHVNHVVEFGGNIFIRVQIPKFLMMLFNTPSKTSCIISVTKAPLQRSKYLS